MPDNRIIVNQQKDSTLVYNMNNQLLSTFWKFKDSCIQNAEGGVIGVCLDPNYVVNKYVYIYYIHNAGYNLYRIVRFTENNNKGTNPFIIFNDSSGQSGSLHFGGNMHFGKDGKLYVSIGDNSFTANAQSLSTFKGKILRINSDGTIPTDNPFYDDGNPKSGNDDRIWVLGVKNVYDFTISPFNDSIYAGENGGIQNDEINFIKKGLNYGWPVCRGFCVPYNPLYKQPMDTIGGNSGSSYAPTGILIYNGSQMPELYGKLITAGAGDGIVRGILKYNLANPPFLDTISSHSVLSSYYPCTCMKQGSDGFIYISTYSIPNSVIVKMKYNTVGINSTQTPAVFKLDQNYPNPFNPETKLRFALYKTPLVTLKIYDCLGNEVTELVNREMTEGTHEISWNASEYSCGVYFCRLTAGELTDEKKLVLLK
jgi:glucose/arabinose dehydrogenase